MAKGTCTADGCAAPVRCSQLCATHYKKALYAKKKAARPKRVEFCGGCGEQFTLSQHSYRYKTWYCSPYCRNVAAAARQRATRQAVRETITCLWCGADITHMRSDAKYCSDACSNRVDYRDNKERIDTYRRKWVEGNRERARATDRAYREQNRDAIYAKQRAWIDANRERHRTYQRNYQRQYAIDHPDRIRLHVANRKAWKRDNGGGACEVSDRDWHRLLVIYRHRCAYCGCKPESALHLEHVIPLARGGRHSIGNIVPACARCNQTKNDRLLIEWRLDIPRRNAKRAVTTPAS